MKGIGRRIAEERNADDDLEDVVSRIRRDRERPVRAERHGIGPVDDEQVSGALLGHAVVAAAEETCRLRRGDKNIHRIGQRILVSGIRG